MVHNNFQLTQAGVYRVLVTFNRTLKLKPVHNLSSPPFSLTSQFKRNQAFVQTYFLYKAIKLFLRNFLTFLILGAKRVGAREQCSQKSFELAEIFRKIIKIFIHYHYIWCKIKNFFEMDLKSGKISPFSKYL